MKPHPNFLFKAEGITQKIDSIFLVGAPLHDSTQEVLGSFSIEKEVEVFCQNISDEQQQRMYFYSSQDDTVVDFSDLLEYKKIFPKAKFREYTHE